MSWEGSLLRFDGLSISKRGGKFYHSAHSLCQLQVALLFLCPKTALRRAMHAVLPFAALIVARGPGPRKRRQSQETEKARQVPGTKRGELC